MFKFNNKRPSSHSDVVVECDVFPPYLVPVDTGEETVLMPEDDRYRGIPADAYSLENQLAEGVPLKECSTYIALEGVHGADVADRVVTKFRSIVEEKQLDDARAAARHAISASVSSIPAAISQSNE